jgi:hypothetical protein
MTVTIGDRTKTLAGWSAELGLTISVIYHRIRADKTGEQIIAPVGQPAVSDKVLGAARE